MSAPSNSDDDESTVLNLEVKFKPAIANTRVRVYPTLPICTLNCMSEWHVLDFNMSSAEDGFSRASTIGNEARDTLQFEVRLDDELPYAAFKQQSIQFEFSNEDNTTTFTIPLLEFENPNIPTRSRRLVLPTSDSYSNFTVQKGGYKSNSPVKMSTISACIDKWFEKKEESVLKEIIEHVDKWIREGGKTTKKQYCKKNNINGTEKKEYEFRHGSPVMLAKDAIKWGFTAKSEHTFKNTAKAVEMIEFVYQCYNDPENGGVQKKEKNTMDTFIERQFVRYKDVDDYNDSLEDEAMRKLMDRKIKFDMKNGTTSTFFEKFLELYEAKFGPASRDTNVVFAHLLEEVVLKFSEFETAITNLSGVDQTKFGADDQNNKKNKKKNGNDNDDDDDEKNSNNKKKNQQFPEEGIQFILGFLNHSPNKYKPPNLSILKEIVIASPSRNLPGRVLFGKDSHTNSFKELQLETQRAAKRFCSIRYEFYKHKSLLLKPDNRRFFNKTMELPLQELELKELSEAYLASLVTYATTKSQESSDPR